MPQQCEMIVGFLTPHRCPNPAVAACTQCGLQFCEEHLDIRARGLVCTACQQGLEKPVAIAPVAREFDESDLAVFSRAGAIDSFDAADDLFSDLS